VLQSTGDPRVDAYRDRVFREGGSGWRPFLLRAFAGVKANPAILAAVEERPATAADYVRKYVTTDRIAAGRRLYAEWKGRIPTPNPGPAPLEVQLALWGMLSDYGAKPPPFDMIEALLNLGAYGKGPPFTEFNIYQAVQILAEGRIERSKARAYADGRIGQVRWYTDQYLNWGKDGDGDGRIDIWTNRADIFANLGALPWEADGMPLLVEVRRPKLDPSDPQQRRMLQGLMSNQNVHATWLAPADGRAWLPEETRWFGRYFEPFGPDGPVYLAASRNFTPVSYRNPFLARYEDGDNHPGFGMAVGLLADAIAGRPGPTRPIR
jgi:membrane-bound lytic murein transglycosylase B